MASRLKEGVRCRVCGKDVIMIFHYYSKDNVEFEYVHRHQDLNPNGTLPTCIILAPDFEAAKIWRAEEDEAA